MYTSQADSFARTANSNIKQTVRKEEEELLAPSQSVRPPVPGSSVPAMKSLSVPNTNPSGPFTPEATLTYIRTYIHTQRNVQHFRALYQV